MKLNDQRNSKRQNAIHLAILIAVSIFFPSTACGAPISGAVSKGDQTSIPMLQSAICSDIVPEAVQIENGAQITPSEKVQLDNGIVLFVPSKQTVVQTKFCSVNIGANSVVLLAALNDGLSVYDLDDRHKSSVSVDYDGKQLSLAPGHHVLLTEKAKLEFGRVNPVPTISHRNLQEQAITPELTMYRSEFSIISAIDSVSALKKLFTSRDSATSKLSERILKTAAIVMTRSNYQYYIPTAMVRR